MKYLFFRTEINECLETDYVLDNARDFAQIG